MLLKVRAITETLPPLTQHEAIDPNRRSRHETRRVEVFDAVPGLFKTQWNGLIKRVVRVTRSTLIRRTKDGLWDRREEVSFYLCSAAISAEKSAGAIRSHWGVENRNHYVRDVAMQEDASRIRTNPGIFARARSFALNILRINGEENIANALWCNALDINRVFDYRLK